MGKRICLRSVETERERDIKLIYIHVSTHIMLSYNEEFNQSVFPYILSASVKDELIILFSRVILTNWYHMEAVFSVFVPIQLFRSVLGGFTNSSEYKRSKSSFKTEKER